MTSTPTPAGRGQEATASRVLSPYEQLKRDISAGEFAPGFPLVEVTLAETFGVSRTPIREALTRLEQDGLVMRTDRGLVVRDRSPEEILDIYEVRILLAGLAARLAARRRSTLDIIRMRTRLDALIQEDPNDLTAIMRANKAFNQAHWKASHNVPVEEILERLSNQVMARFPRTTMSATGRLPESIIEHERLLAAIEAQDEELSAEVAIQHVEESRNIRLAMWSQDGQSSF